MNEIHSRNICFINTTSFWGGGEKWHLETALKAAENGISTFFVCSPNSPLRKRLVGSKVQLFSIPNGNLGFLSIFKIVKLVRFLRGNNIECIVFNSPKDLKLGGIAARLAKVKTVVYRRGIAVEVKKSLLTQWLFSNAVSHFIFNSEATRKLILKNYGVIISKKKNKIIYNPIAIPNVVTSVSNERFIIGNAGRMVEQKGQHYLLQLASILKVRGFEFEIRIAGEGPKHAELQLQITQDKLSEHVKLLGFVEDIPAFLSEIDILVSTAIWEGFGFVLAEAMAHKKPCIAFDISSNPELIKNKKNGFLIPPFQLEVLADKIMELKEDSSKRKQMGEDAYLFVKQNFDKDLQFQKFIQFINS